MTYKPLTFYKQNEHSKKNSKQIADKGNKFLIKKKQTTTTTVITRAYLIRTPVIHVGCLNL